MSEIIDFKNIQREKTLAKTGRSVELIDGNNEGRDDFGYSDIMASAMKDVIRTIIKKISIEGMPGNHCLYVKFDTTHEGVEIDDILRAQYPDEMSIVLQCRYSDFTITDDMFAVTLSFNGIEKRIKVPFDAIASVIDPTVPFGVGIFDPVNY